MARKRTDGGTTFKVHVAPTTITSTSKWSVADVTAAIECHENGDFSRSAQLSIVLDRDDRISPCLDDRVNALIGAGAADFTLEPAEKFIQRSKVAIDRIAEWYDTSLTSAWKRQVLRGAIKMGFSLSWVPWERTSKSWVPGIPEVWPDEHIWIDEAGYFVANTTAGPVRILPEDPNWFLFCPGGKQSWMCGALRGLGMPWVMRSFTPRDWARYNERHGLPLIVIKEPNGSHNAAEKAAFYGGIRKMGSNGIIRAPQGKDEHSSYGVDLVEAKARSFDSFDKFLDRLNVAIAIYIKGQNLTTEVQQGAYASTGWHMRVRADYAKNDADAFGEAERNHFFKWFGRFNLPSWDDRIAPWPTWKLDVPEDQTQVATSFDTAMKAIEKALIHQVPIDWDYMLPRLGMKLEPGKKMPTVAGVQEAGSGSTEDKQDDEKDAAE